MGAKWVPAAAVIPTPQVLMSITGREAGVGGYVIWILLGTQGTYNVMRIAHIQFKSLTGVVEGSYCILCGEEEFGRTTVDNHGES